MAPISAYPEAVTSSRPTDEQNIKFFKLQGIRRVEDEQAFCKELLKDRLVLV